MRWFLNTTNLLLVIVIVLVLAVLYQARVYHTASTEPPPTSGVCDAADVAAGAAHCPRLTAEQIFGSYLGAAKTPETDTCNGTSNGFGYFAYGGLAMSTSTSAFVTNGYCIAEITWPSLSKAADPAQLPVITFKQNWWLSTALWDGFSKDVDAVNTSGFNFGGLLAQGDKLYLGGYGFYGTRPAPHDKSWLRLNRNLASNAEHYPGAVEVWHPTTGVATTQGFVGGYAAWVPPEWQAALHGPAVVGGQCMSIVTRTSNGGALIAINPADINTATPPVRGTALMYELGEEWGAYNGSSALWGGTGCVGGVVLFPGTRTALFLGWNGTGEFCYGPACHDPEFPNVEGQHAYPYHYQYWLIDLADLAAVAAGKKSVTSVLPYAYGTLQLPYVADQTKMRGVTYDPTSRNFYFLQTRVVPTTPGYRFHPVLHGYHVAAAAVTSFR